MKEVLANIHIEDSYKIKTLNDMYSRLAKEELLDSTSLVWNRSRKSLIREWRAHNLLYELHISRSRTKDVDLDYPAHWYTDVVYFVLSCLYPYW